MSTQKDSTGKDYFSPDSKPADHGVSVQIPNGWGGSSAGTMQGGVAVPNKK